MTKCVAKRYVVFVSKTPTPSFLDRAMGYLDNVAFNHVIKEPFVVKNILKCEDLGAFFYDDGITRAILTKMSQKGNGVAIRAEVLDESKLTGNAEDFCQRYRFSYLVYYA